MAEENNNKWISGFWRRVGALLIDSIILGLVGLALGLVFEKQFVEIGGLGRFIGFFMALTYFGVMNSKLSGGQTLGKKVLEIKVVNANNQTIGVLRSFARFCILGIPYFLNGSHFTNEIMTTYLVYPISFIIGGLFSVAYLYIFNRLTRQSLHDLIVGTFVVNTTVEKQSTVAVWRVHLIVVSILFFIATIAPAFISNVVKSDPFSKLLSVQTAMMKNPSVSYATVNYGKTSIIWANESKKTTTYVNAQVFLKQDTVDDKELAKHLAKILTINYPDSLQSDAIIINLTYGYDIGISSKWKNYGYSYNPNELMNNIQK